MAISELRATAIGHEMAAMAAVGIDDGMPVMLYLKRPLHKLVQPVQVDIAEQL